MKQSIMVLQIRISQTHFLFNACVQMLIEDRALNQVTALYFKRMEGSDGTYQPPRQAAGKVGSEF